MASLSDLGQITGNLSIFMGERDQRDLSFLSCLHTINGALEISSNMLLESTEGLENLRDVKVLSVYQNPNLRMLAGLEKVHELVGFKIYLNSALQEIQLDSIESVDWMKIGDCVGAGGDAGNSSLGDLGGFGALAKVENLHIDGNVQLMSADLLEALKANGAPAPLTFAAIRFNPLLSQTAVHASLDALGVQSREVCGNAGGEGDEECLCSGSD